MSALKSAINRHFGLSELLVFGLAAYVLASAFLTASDREDPFSLVVYKLEYVNGEFRQNVAPDIPSIVVNAGWTASIQNVETGRIECSGGARAPYTQSKPEAVMSPDVWTGDKCDLVPGKKYLATASWEYVNAFGNTERISKQIEFIALEIE